LNNTTDKAVTGLVILKSSFNAQWKSNPTPEDVGIYLLTNPNAVTQSLGLTLDMYSNADNDGTHQMYLWAIPVVADGDPRPVLAGESISVYMDWGTPVGVLDQYSFSATDVSYLDVNGSYQYLPSNTTTWFDLLGLIGVDDLHDDPNLSLGAVFSETVAERSNYLTHAIQIYIATAKALGIDYNSKYINQGVTNGVLGMIPATKWLNADGPFAGLTTQQKVALLYTFYGDILSASQYIEESVTGSQVAVQYTNPVPTTI